MRYVPPLVLALSVLGNLARGAIHAFAPDGGAHSIAGLDLTTNAATILSLFAQIGFHQIAAGLFSLYVLVWRRDLVTLALGLMTLETAFAVVGLWFYRTLPVAVPGAPFNAAMLVVLIAAFGVALARHPKHA